MLPVPLNKKEEFFIPTGQMPFSLSNGEKQEDPTSSTVKKVLKRSFDQMNVDKPGEKDTAKRAEYNDWSSDANPLWHYLKSKSDACNPYAEVNVKILINKDHADKEQYLSFPITQAALRKIAPSFYEKIFFTGSSWKENVEKEVKWIGDEASPFYHPEAAAQVILFAYMKGGIINRSAYRSLEQLRQNFSDEFPWILNDIFRLCDQHQIPKMQKHCQDFLEVQMKQSNDDVVYYLQWALATSHQINGLKIWKQAVAKKLENDVHFFKSLRSLIEIDYHECSEKQKTLLFKVFQEFFNNKLLSAKPLSPYDLKFLAPYELKDFGLCFLSLYRDGDIPELVQRKIEHFFDDYMKISDGKPLYSDLLGAEGILAISLCHAFYYDLSNSHSHKPSILAHMNSIPEEEQSKFEEIITFIKAATLPPHEALSIFRKLNEQYPTNLLLLRKAIELSFEEEDIDTAILFLNQLLTLVPNDTLSLERRADCYIRKGKLDLALEDIKKTNPQTVNAAVLLGHLCQCHLYFQNGENELAVTEFENYVNKGANLKSDTVVWTGHSMGWFNYKSPLYFNALQNVLAYLHSKGNYEEKIFIPLWANFYPAMTKLANQGIIREFDPDVLNIRED